MVLAIADVETPESTSRASTHAFSRSSSNISLESNELASFDALIDEALGGLIASTVVQPDMIADPSPPLPLGRLIPLGTENRCPLRRPHILVSRVRR